MSTRYAHGRVGVKRKPLSPGQAKYKERRAADRPARFRQLPVAAHSDFVVTGRSLREKMRTLRDESQTKRLVRGAGVRRHHGESWVDAWGRVVAAQIRAQAETGAIKVEENEEGSLVPVVGEHETWPRQTEDEIIDPLTEPDPEPDEVMNVSQVAEYLDKGQTWVKEHAEELGGTKHALRWKFSRNAIDQWAAEQ